MTKGQRKRSLVSSELDASSSKPTKLFKDMDASEYVKHLKVLQNIRDIAGGQALNLPQMCVVGDQSSGKSSLLKLITGVDFPVNSGTCTKAAIVVECKQGEESYFAIQNTKTKLYDPCTYNEMAPRILSVQQSLLTNASLCSKISDVEIKVKVIGPDMIDIIVVDLPGIINVGEGASETRQLIKQYIEPIETLILLVSEAKQDKELITAVELASEFDPKGERTMHIYTKFDTFDTEESKYRAINWITDQKMLLLGAHAVIAAPGGRDYDSSLELEYLSCVGLPSDRVGMSTLKSRLPTLFSKLISTNIPGLNSSIEAKASAAKLELQKIGERPMDSLLVVKICQDILLQKQSAFQSDMTQPMEAFQKAIRDCKTKITEEWTAQVFPSNFFVCPFFSGNDSFRQCLVTISEWWKPLLETYTGAVEKIVIGIPKYLKGSHIAISDNLYRSIDICWKLFCQDLLASFKISCYAELEKFRDFGTINDDLIKEYQGEINIPKKFIEESIASIETADFYNNSTNTVLSLRSTKELIKTKLEDVRLRYQNKFKLMSLHEQQKYRLHAAVLATYSVEEKTFTDMIVKQSIHLLGKIHNWIINSLMINQEIKSAAVEDKTITQKRELLQDILDKMTRCLKEISQIM